MIEGKKLINRIRLKRIMKEEIIDGIKYRLDEDNLTAEVIEYDYAGDIKIPDTIEFNEVSYRVTSIGNFAFADCDSLTSVVIPDSVTSIGDHAFYYCKRMTKIKIPDSVTSIGQFAFTLCRCLTKIKIPNSVKNIELSAFSDCVSLQEVTIPDSVKSIGNYAFSNCSSLIYIFVPNSVISIGHFAFENCKKMEAIAIGNNVTSIGKYAFSNCESLVYIVVAPGNTVYDSRDKCHAIIETATNTLICGSRTFTIPNSVTSIGDYAFNGRKSRTSITIPNSVTSIGMMAFGNCSLLQEITIPDSIMSIGRCAFGKDTYSWGSSSLNTICYDSTIAQWKKIELTDGWNNDIPAKVVHCTDGDVEI